MCFHRWSSMFSPSPRWLPFWFPQFWLANMWKWHHRDRKNSGGSILVVESLRSCTGILWCNDWKGKGRLWVGGFFLWTLSLWQIDTLPLFGLKLKLNWTVIMVGGWWVQKITVFSRYPWQVWVPLSARHYARQP